jgi:hypothetical protein
LCIRLCFECKTIQNHVSPFNYTGRRRGGAMMSGPLVNGSSQTAAPFSNKIDRWLHFKFRYNSMDKRKFYPIMTLGMALLRWWMPPMKMDLRCPSTPAASWQAPCVLLPRGDLP